MKGYYVREYGNRRLTRLADRIDVGIDICFPVAAAVLFAAIALLVSALVLAGIVALLVSVFS